MNDKNHPLAMSPRSAALLLSALMVAPAAWADLRPGGMFLEVGGADHSTYAATAGLVWPWAWKSVRLGGELTASTEVFASYWSARAASGRQSFTQVGIVPLLRYRFSGGSSPWFVEGGIGISLLNEVYRTPHKQFGSSGNFYDVLAVGRSLGDARSQELSLRLTHMSNADIKRPNPGENFLQLRYGMKF
jgi:hypothetical protein